MDCFDRPVSSTDWFSGNNERMPAGKHATKERRRGVIADRSRADITQEIAERIRLKIVDRLSELKIDRITLVGNYEEFGAT